MTTSNKVEQFYNALVKDPELDIKPGQTREQAARMEANYRARQYDNNAKALAMATTPDESPINSLFNHLEQMKKSVNDVVLIKAVEEYSNNSFSDMYFNVFGGGGTTAEKGWGFANKVEKLSAKQKQNLATNIYQYADPTREIARNDKDEKGNLIYQNLNPDEMVVYDIQDHIASLPNELREKVFQAFLKATPVEISASPSRRDSLVKNKYLSRKNSKRLTTAGFAHLLSFNKHGDFKLSNSKKLTDLSNEENVDDILPKNYNDLKPTQEEIDDYYSSDVFENRDAAKKWFDAQRPQTRKDFGNVSSTATTYYGGMGGKNSLKAADIDDHIANYNKVLDSDEQLDFYDNEDLLQRHDSNFFSSSESDKKTQADKKDIKDSSNESVGPSATIHGVTLDSDYLADQGDGTYKIDPMAFEGDDFKQIWSGTFESEGQTKARALTPEHRKYLEGLSFKAGATVGKEPSDASQGSLENEIKTDRFTTTTSSKTSSKKGSKSSSKQKKTEDTTEDTTEDKTEDKEDPTVESQLDKAEKDGLIRHAYEQELGLGEDEEDEFHTYEDYKKDFIDEHSDKSLGEVNKKLGQIGKSKRQFDKKAADAKTKKEAAETKERERKEAAETKEREADAKEEERRAKEEERQENQAAQQQDREDEKQQKADAKTEKQVDSIINSKSFLDKNIMDYINAVGPYESKSNQTDVAKKRRSTLMYQKLMGDLHQISKAGKITRATADKYDAAAAKLIEIGADAKKAQNQYTEFVNKGELTVAGQKVTDFGSEEHMNLLEADFQGLKGDEAKNYKGHFNQYGPVAKLREIDPEGKFWGGPKETQEAPEKPTSTDATGDEDYEGSDIPNEFRGYGTPPEGVRTYTGPQGGSFYDTREADSKGDSEGSPSIFGGKVTPQQYGEAIIDTARAAGQAEIDAGKAVGRGVVAGAKGVAGAATAGAKKIKETGAKVGRAFTDPSPSPVGAGEMFAGTVGGAGKAVGRAAGRVAGAAAKGAKAAKTQVESLGPDAKEIAGVARDTAGAAAKGAKAAKTQVSESVGADVARATAGAAREGATKVAGATAAGASKVAQAGKAGIGRITGTGKKGAGKAAQAGKTAGERLREFVADDSKYEYTSPTERRRVPGRSFSQRVQDLFKADDIENPEGLARWLASKYDGVATTTKPGEPGWERIQSYLTALKDPKAQHNKGKVNRIRNPQTGERVRGKLRGSSKVKGPKSFAQRAKAARERGVSMHDLATGGFKAPNEASAHRGSYSEAEMKRDKHSGGKKTIADKHLGHKEGYERKFGKRVRRMARQAGEMTKQMPSDELLHKQRQDILERLEKLV